MRGAAQRECSTDNHGSSTRCSTSVGTASSGSRARRSVAAHSSNSSRACAGLAAARALRANQDRNRSSPASVGFITSIPDASAQPSSMPASTPARNSGVHPAG